MEINVLSLDLFETLLVSDSSLLGSAMYGVARKRAGPLSQTEHDMFCFHPVFRLRLGPGSRSRIHLDSKTICHQADSEKGMNLLTNNFSNIFSPAKNLVSAFFLLH